MSKKEKNETYPAVSQELLKKAEIVGTLTKKKKKTLIVKNFKKKSETNFPFGAGCLSMTHL